MKSLKLIIALLGVCLLPIAVKAEDCFFGTPVSCSTECDQNSLYKTCDGDLYGKTFFSFRPQDSDSSRRILSWFNIDYPKWFSSKKAHILTISPQYTRSFDPKKTAQWFFFNGRDAMTVGIPGAYDEFDIDGSQIGLSLGTLYDPENDTLELISGKIGSVWSRPLVENYIIDVDLWYDLSKWHKDLWSRIDFSVVNARTSMRMRAKGRGTQVDEYPLGLFSLESTTVDEAGDQVCGSTPVPYSSIIGALEGNKGWGAVLPLKSGKFPARTLSKWGVAGVHFDLGYDIYNLDPLYVAGSLHMVFPTGTRPTGTYLFEPIIGANKCWQIGATAITRYIKRLQRCELGIYFYAVGTHLFKSSQNRVYSLTNNGPGSQLLLLKQFQVSQVSLIDAERTANILCGRAKIGSTLMFDGSLMFQVSHKKLVADIGYNFWARTKEKRSKAVVFRGFYEDTLGVKGDTPMENQEQIPPDIGPIQCLSNTETESKSTIAAPGPVDPVNTSQVTVLTPSAVFIQPCNVNYGSPLSPSVMSHKVFGGIGFKSSWFVLLSAEAEFGTNNAVINQWGLMLKVGKDF